MKGRAWQEINAVAGEGEILTLQPRGVNLECKVLEFPRHCCIFWCSKYCYESWLCSVKQRSLLCSVFKFVSSCSLSFSFTFFLRFHIILSAEQTVRQTINSALSVSDGMFLVYWLSQFSGNIVRVTETFCGLCTFLYDTPPS